MGQNERPMGPGPIDGSSQPSQNVNLPPASEREVPFHVAMLSVPSPDHAKVTADTGKEANEDFSAVDLPTRTVLVEDGVGGKGDGGGYLASRLAAKTIREALAESDAYPTQNFEEIEARFRNAISRAHNKVLDEKKVKDAELLAENPNIRRLPEFATTVSLAREVVLPDGSKQLVWASAGDSSIRVFRNGELLKVTTAHSAQKAALDSEFIDRASFERIEGLLEQVEHPGIFWKENPTDMFGYSLGEEFMHYFSQRNLISSAVGLNDDIAIVTGVFQLQEGDIVLMYTDGVDDTLTKEEIKSIVADAKDNVTGIPQALITAAQQKCAQPNAIWDGNYVGDSGRAKPDDITVAAWKA